jgi:hypothetical protein
MAMDWLWQGYLQDSNFSFGCVRPRVWGNLRVFIRIYLYSLFWLTYFDMGFRPDAVHSWLFGYLDRLY